MIAPPSVNLRRGKKGGKEKQEVVRQPISIVMEEETITFEVVRGKLLDLFSAVDNIKAALVQPEAPSFS